MRLDYVQGYVVANDVYARDLLFSDGQWARAKSLDTFRPVSEVVPVSEILDPQDLAITILNGRVMQESTTGAMIFSVAELVAFVSEAITLVPGDLILTGTPAAVGAFRTPNVWLTPRDAATVEVERVGSITNPVLRA